MTSDTGQVDDRHGSVPGSVSVLGRIRALLLACHPLPATAVTVLTVALGWVAAVAGNG